MKVNPKYCGLIFDLDNTLIDFLGFKEASIKAAVDAMIRNGLKAKRERVLKAVDKVYAKHGMEYRWVFQDALKELGVKPDYRIIAPAIVAYRDARTHSMKAYPSIKKTLAILRRRGYKLFLVTDAPRVKAWIRLATIGLHQAFDEVITHEDTKNYKATGVPFRMALRRMKLRPEQVVVVGDSLSRDMAPAKRMGMATVLAEYGRKKKVGMRTWKDHSKDGRIPDYIIWRMGDLLRVCR